MPAILEITAGILRVYDDGQGWGDAFRMALPLSGDERIMTLKAAQTMDHIVAGNVKRWVDDPVILQPDTLLYRCFGRADPIRYDRRELRLKRTVF